MKTAFILIFTMSVQLFASGGGPTFVWPLGVDTTNDLFYYATFYNGEVEFPANATFNILSNYTLYVCDNFMDVEGFAGEFCEELTSNLQPPQSTYPQNYNLGEYDTIAYQNAEQIGYTFTTMLEELPPEYFHQQDIGPFPTWQLTGTVSFNTDTVGTLSLKVHSDQPRWIIYATPDLSKHFVFLQAQTTFGYGHEGPLEYLVYPQKVVENHDGSILELMRGLSPDLYQQIFQYVEEQKERIESYNR